MAALDRLRRVVGAGRDGAVSLKQHSIEYVAPVSLSGNRRFRFRHDTKKIAAGVFQDHEIGAGTVSPRIPQSP
jgi:hypothetical protein